MSNRFGSTLKSAISANRTTQLAVAQDAGISSPSVTDLIRGARPSPGTLKGILAALPNHDALDCLCAHLRDEVERAGFLQGQISIGIGEHRASSKDKIDVWLDTLKDAARRRESQGQPDIRNLLQALATVASAIINDESDGADTTRMMVAEESDGPYQGGKIP